MNIPKIMRDILKENEQMSLPLLKQRDTDIDSLLTRKTQKITAITGFRRVGKTFLLFLIMKKLENAPFAYFNFEDERLPESTEVLTQLLYALEELHPERRIYLFLDEIQCMPGWGKFLRRISDAGYKIFVTGSSSKLGLQELPTELRGRVIQRILYPLSFHEYLDFKGIEHKELFSHNESEIKREFYHYLKYGGFPELYDASDLECKEVIQEYFRTLVQRDITQRYKIRQEMLLTSTIKLLLNASMISISKLTNTLRSMGFKCSKNTISNYISFAENSFFLYQSYIYSKNVKDQMHYPRKLYLVDTGFINFLSLNPDEGRQLENLIAIELKRRGMDLYYWRNQRGHEIDFVIIEKEKPVQLIQVSYDISYLDTRERELRALQSGMKYFNLSQALLLTYDHEEILHYENRTIHIQPAWKWLLQK